MVRAHGHIKAIVVDGVSHAGYNPSYAADYGPTAMRPSDNSDQGEAAWRGRACPADSRFHRLHHDQSCLRERQRGLRSRDSGRPGRDDCHMAVEHLARLAQGYVSSIAIAGRPGTSHEARTHGQVPQTSTWVDAPKPAVTASRLTRSSGSRSRRRASTGQPGRRTRSSARSTRTSRSRARSLGGEHP